MPFNPNLQQGQIIDNKELCRIFKCSTQGGMRRSTRTNTLVIVSDHTKAIYEDRWINDVFHYTAMGLRGNQNLSFNQNKTLYESNSNRVDVFLFEVFEKGRYQYQGRIKLVGHPYKENQPDIDGKIRVVWIFPLKLVDGEKPAPIPEVVFKKKQKAREKQASKLSLEELKKKIQSAPKDSGSRNVSSKQYERNQFVAAYAKKRAGGICQLCKSPAPFNDKSGEPFLETHHIEWLAKGGEDSIENIVALCPNCHRKMHILDLDKDKAMLKRQGS